MYYFFDKKGLCSVVGKTQTKENLFNTFLFQENHQKGECIWNNIIDQESLLQIDELNQHPCLRSIFLIIECLKNNMNDTLDQMPPWMFELLKLMISERHLNVKLFVGKIMCNNQGLFSKYAKEWRSPTLNFLSRILYEYGLNCYTVDLLHITSCWCDNPNFAIDTYEEKISVQSFFKSLFENTYVESYENENIRDNILLAFLKGFYNKDLLFPIV